MAAPAPPPPLRQVVVVSPHQDDAALSLSVALAALVRAGVVLTIVTCHTRSRWAPALAGPRTIARVSRVRAGEDRAYARRVPARLIALDFPEAALRVPERPVSGRVDPAHVRALAAALQAPLRGADAVLVPLGLPGHLDHRVTRAAALLVVGRRRLAFYEDLPYALWVSPARLAGVVASVQRLIAQPLHPVRLARDQPALRRAALACYPSQFSPAERRALQDDVAQRGGERLWITGSVRRRLPARLGGYS